jgi:hypothetical protein
MFGYPSERIILYMQYLMISRNCKILCNFFREEWCDMNVLEFLIKKVCKIIYSCTQMWNSNIYWQNCVLFLIEMTSVFLPHFYCHNFLIVLDNQTHHNLLAQWTVNFSYSSQAHVSHGRVFWNVPSLIDNLFSHDWPQRCRCHITWHVNKYTYANPVTSLLPVEDSFSYWNGIYSPLWDTYEIQMHVTFLGEDFNVLISSY